MKIRSLHIVVLPICGMCSGLSPPSSSDNYWMRYHSGLLVLARESLVVSSRSTTVMYHLGQKSSGLLSCPNASKFVLEMCLKVTWHLRKWISLVK